MTLAGALAGSVIAESPALDESKLPPPAQVEVDFDRDIRPIFETSCYRCHGPERPKSRFRLDDRAAALKGGEQGVDIIPGTSGRSPLVHYVARLVPDMEMPPPGKGEPLTAEQVGLLRAWIDQGAKWPESGGTRAKTLFSITPSFAWIHVSGDKRQFREHWGLKEGWSGGVQEFQLEERSETGVKLNAEGRALYDQHDYQVKLRLEKPDLGFARFGYEQYRRYYDDTGGYAEQFPIPAFSLGRDLYIDVGRAWFDVGLTLPNWPRMVLGYEYQFREGDKSSLAWADVSYGAFPNEVVRGIYPAYKALDERTHIIKFDISHEVAGIHLEDNLRTEFYDLDSTRVEYGFFDLAQGGPSLGLSSDEDYDHFQAVNTLRAEKQLKDWLLVSAGYLYSNLRGDGSFSQQAFTPSTLLPLGDPLDGSEPIVIRRESHVYNLSSLWGPWHDLSLSAGFQNEFTRETGFGRGLFRFPDPDQPPMQHRYDSERDRVLFQEDVGLRYTGLPLTVVFADGRLRQDWTDHRESAFESPSGNDFLRDTDAAADLKEVRTGFTVSPWTRASFNAAYRHRLSHTDYNHQLDTFSYLLDPAFGIDPSNGYPAFIRERDIELDEFEARVVLHPAKWLKTSLKYQLVAVDYTTVTDPSVELFTNELQPGGQILAGNYDAHIYSINATVTPTRRLNISTTLSYQDARTVSGVNGRAGVEPYQGDIFNVLNAVNFVISNSTDWQASYSFSHADFQQRNKAETLPLGIEYDRHGLLTGLSRRFGKNITARLQYGFFLYDEPSFGRVNNYTAHAVFGSLAMVLR